MTALTLYGIETASTLATACKLVTSVGGTSASLTTKIGTVQGSGELFSLGSTATFPGTTVSTSAGVHGYLWDVVTLAGNTIAAGTWTVKFNLNFNLTYTTMSTTITSRVWKRTSGGVYTKIGSDMTVAGPGASTTAQTLYTLTGSSFPAMDFATGDQLYMDVWLTATSSGGATTRTIALWASSHATLGIAGQVEIDTPGYAPTPSPVNLSGVSVVVAQDTLIRADVVGSLGTATDGQVWATPAGTGTQAVTSNEGVLTNTSGLHLILGSKTTANVDIAVRIAYGATTDDIGPIVRIAINSDCYRLTWTGGNVALIKRISGVDTSLATATATLTAGVFYWFRFRIIGTQQSGKFWQDGTGEPTDWIVSSSGDTSVTGLWQCGLRAGGVGTTAASFDSFTVADTTVLHKGVGTLTGTLTISSGTSSVKNAKGRTLLSISSIRNGIGRAKIAATKVRSGMGRVLTSIKTTKNGLGRIKISATKVLNTTGRTRFSVSHVSNGIGRTKLSVPKISNAIGRMKLSVRILRNGIGRIRTSISALRNASGRIVVSVKHVLNGSGRAGIAISHIRNAVGRVLIKATTVRSGIGRLKLSTGTVISRNGLGRILLKVTALRSGVGRIKFGVAGNRKGMGRTALSILMLRKASGRFALVVSKRLSALARVRISAITTLQGRGRSRIAVSKHLSASGRGSIVVALTRKGMGRVLVVVSAQRIRSGVGRVLIKLAGVLIAYNAKGRMKLAIQHRNQAFGRMGLVVYTPQIEFDLPPNQVTWQVPQNTETWEIAYNGGEWDIF